MSFGIPDFSRRQRLLNHPSAKVKEAAKQTLGQAAVNGGANALSLVNTFNSIMGVDLDTFAPMPAVRGDSSHGGYCGPAIKPIALYMVSALAGDSKIRVPISGIGGIQAWQDAVEFLLLGAGSVQVCTAVMHYGFRLVEQLSSGLENWMLEKGFERSFFCAYGLCLETSVRALEKLKA